MTGPPVASDISEPGRPKVSVVIPAYNPGAYLQEAVGSALSQATAELTLEVVVVDDGSAEPVDLGEAAGDPRVRLLHQENAGPAAARNRGVRSARGTFVAFLDADDLWLPGGLAERVKLLERWPEAGLCYGRCRPLDTEDRPVARRAAAQVRGHGPRMIFKELLQGNFIPNLTVVVPREVIERVGGFDEGPSVVAAEDFDLWLRITASCPAVATDSTVGIYRIHPGALTSGVDRACRAAETVLLKNMALAADLGVDRQLVLEALACLYHDWGRDQFHSADHPAARSPLVRSLLLAPSRGETWAFLAASLLPSSANDLLRTSGRALRSVWTGLTGGSPVGATGTDHHDRVRTS